MVTVAVQTAAGSAAILSTFPALARPLGDTKTLLLIAVAATLIMCYGNLRGVRENGKTFGVPTYWFTGAVTLMIILGVGQEIFGGLPHVKWHAGTVAIGHHSGLFTWVAIFFLGRAFANGGSSLTGIEAVSNAVSALRPPEGRNARQLLVIQGSIVAFLIAGISWLAHVTHAVPYQNGFPTVVSQEAKLIFGSSIAGQIMFYVLQLGAIAILFTGGNTSFSGFPFLTSFVAEDSFLPRWLSKRGHRLVFSNGIIVLTVLALCLLLGVGANTNSLVPFYAIGVFTGFSMAGFGTAKYHRRTREPYWRRKLAINLAGGVYTALVVLIFAIVKFTEGAWLVLLVFPIFVFAFIRLNREYGMEAQVLERISDRPKPPQAPNYTRRTVFVFVDSFDLATIAALRYARSLRPTTLRAVHFVIDTAQADALREEWTRAGIDVVLDFIDCADRRLTRGAAELVSAEAEQPGVQVTVVLPRRSYSPADRPAAARPHRRQDRGSGQPDPARGRDHRPLRRAEQAGGAARPPGGPGRAGGRGQDARARPGRGGSQAGSGRGRGRTPRRPAEVAGRDDPGPGQGTAGQGTAGQGTAGQGTAGQGTAVAGNGAGTGTDGAAPAAGPPTGSPRSSPRRPGSAGCCAAGVAARTSRPRPRRRATTPATTGPRPPWGSTRSARWPGRAGPRSRAGSGRSRSGRSSGTSVLAVDVSDSTGDLPPCSTAGPTSPASVRAEVRFRGPWGCARKARS